MRDKMMILSDLMSQSGTLSPAQLNDLISGKIIGTFPSELSSGQDFLLDYCVSVLTGAFCLSLHINLLMLV